MLEELRDEVRELVEATSDFAMLDFIRKMLSEGKE